MGIKAQGAKGYEILKWEPDKLSEIALGHNPSRSNLGADLRIDELARSIAAQGQLQPGVVRKDWSLEAVECGVAVDHLDRREPAEAGDQYRPALAVLCFFLLALALLDGPLWAASALFPVLALAYVLLSWLIQAAAATFRFAARRRHWLEFAAAHPSAAAIAPWWARPHPFGRFVCALLACVGGWAAFAYLATRGEPSASLAFAASLLASFLMAVTKPAMPPESER